MDRIETVESEYWYDFKMAVSRSNDKMICRPLSLPAAYTHFECSFTSSILLPMCISVQNDLGYRPYRTRTECLHVFLLDGGNSVVSVLFVDKLLPVSSWPSASFMDEPLMPCQHCSPSICISCANSTLTVLCVRERDGGEQDLWFCMFVVNLCLFSR